MVYQEGMSNIIYICHKGFENDRESEIYGDDLNQATLDFFKVKRDF